MSEPIDPAKEPRQITVLEYEALVGRQGAMELLLTQAWVAVLNGCKDEHRDDIVSDALIEFENRFSRLHPIGQQVGLECAENILSSALATVRQPRAS